MIFDAHTHLMKCSRSRLIDEEELSLLLARADTCGVDRVVLLGAVTIEIQNPSRDTIQLINDQTIEVVRRHPDRLSGFCYVNPRHEPSFTLDEMDRCIAGGGGALIGVKLEIALNARDARHDPLMEHCAALDCPLLYHAWYKVTGNDPEESNPSDIADLARRHPNVRIIMAHMMGCGIQGMSDVAPLPNVCVDFSGSPPAGGIFEYALEMLGPERIVFGSDYPIRDFATQLGKLNSQDLPEDGREAIRWRNLHRLLGTRSPC